MLSITFRFIPCFCNWTFICIYTVFPTPYPVLSACFMKPILGHPVVSYAMCSGASISELCNNFVILYNIFWGPWLFIIMTCHFLRHSVCFSVTFSGTLLSIGHSLSPGQKSSQCHVLIWPSSVCPDNIAMM